jgi:hypothetical protein
MIRDLYRLNGKPAGRCNALVPAVILTAVLLTGCQNGPIIPTAPGTTGNIALANFQPTTDMPIPTGAKFMSDQSLVLSNKDYWTGRLVLESDSKISQIHAFYMQEMPPLGWEPVASVLSTSSVLTFIRQNRTATVQIQPNSFSGSTISVTVATRQLPNAGFYAPAAGRQGAMMPQTQQNPSLPSPPPDVSRNARPSPTDPVYQTQIPQVYR